MIFPHQTITVLSQHQDPLAKDSGYQLLESNPEQTKFTYIREKKEFILKRLGFLALTVIFAIIVIPVFIDRSCLKRMWTRGWTGQEKRIVTIANKILQPEKKASTKLISEQEKIEIQQKLDAIQDRSTAKLRTLVKLITTECTPENLISDDERSVFLKKVFSEKFNFEYIHTFLDWQGRGTFDDLKLSADQNLILNYFILLQGEGTDSGILELMEKSNDSVKQSFYKNLLESDITHLTFSWENRWKFLEKISDDSFKTTYLFKLFEKNLLSYRKNLYKYLIGSNIHSENPKFLIKSLTFLDQKKIDLQQINGINDPYREYAPTLEQIHAILNTKNPTILRFLNIEIRNIPENASAEYLKALITLNPNNENDILSRALKIRSTSFVSKKSNLMPQYHPIQSVLKQYCDLAKLIHDLDFEVECFDFLNSLEKQSIATSEIKKEFVRGINSTAYGILYHIDRNLNRTDQLVEAFVNFVRSYKIENKREPYDEFIEKAKEFVGKIAHAE